MPVIPSANLPPQETDPAIYIRELYDAIAMLPGVVEQKLPSPDKPLDAYADIRQHNEYTAFIDLARPRELASTIDEAGDVRQSLHAIVKAGDELFGVVTVGVKHINENSPGHAWVSRRSLTHIGKSGEQAEAVGAITNGNPLHVGRTLSNGYSTKTSREHFLAGEAHETLIITDLESTNHTTILAIAPERSPSDANASQAGIGLSAVRKVIGRRRAKTARPSPLLDDRVWSLKSEEAKRLIRDEHNRMMDRLQPGRSI